MKLCGACKTLKDRSEFNARAMSLDGLAAKCRPCCKAYAAAYQAKNPEKLRIAYKAKYEKNKEASLAHSKAWAEANPEKVFAAKMKYYLNNREKNKVKQKARYEENKDAYLAACAEYSRLNPWVAKAAKARWKKNNPGKVRADGALRRTKQMRATPPWADIMAIEAIYKESARITRETGVQHHVDHIIPLRGRNVSGLHVHWNLRVISAKENYAKSYKLLPELATAAGLPPQESSQGNLFFSLAA